MIAEVTVAMCSVCGSIGQVIVDLRARPEAPICIHCCLGRANDLSFANSMLGAALASEREKVRALRELFEDFIQHATSCCSDVLRDWYRLEDVDSALAATSEETA